MIKTLSKAQKMEREKFRIDILPVPTDEAARQLQSTLLGVETNVANWQRRQNANNNFTATIPYDMELQRKETKEMLDDLTTRDQRMMFGLVTLVHLADSKEQLDSDTETLYSTARKHLCQLSTLRWQQKDGLDTVLPYGLRKIQALRTLTTESTAVLIPFRAQEIMQPNGLYYGQNAVSKNMIVADRRLLLNGNSFRLGVSGSGKTTLVLESLIPALEAAAKGEALPAHVESITAPGIAQVKLIDATPIGINVRSTVATYANVHDELRKIYARSPLAREKGYKAGDFSYNTGKLKCPVCDGTGQISLDVQFLPDVDVPCPECNGSRYAKEAWEIGYENKQGNRYSLPELMEMDVNTALQATADLKVVHQRLEVLKNLGLGYLTLGEETPSLSGGEAQRLKLASEMGKGQSDSVFVFDEPTIGLHPLDVQTLLSVFDALVDNGATVLVIEHDLDVIRNADYIIDMGPGGGDDGGRVIATGTPEEIVGNEDSVTGRYL